MQTIVITGRLGQDAEEKSVGQNNSDLLTFSVASDQGFGERKKTNWFKCDLWGARGKALSHTLVKGKEVTVSGELEIVERDGRTYHNIRVADIGLHGKNESPGQSGGYGGGAGDSPNGQSRATDLQNDLDDDVPFLRSDFDLEGRVS